MVTIEEITIAGKRGFSEGEKNLIENWMVVHDRVHNKLHHYIRNQFNDDFCGNLAELGEFLTGKKYDLLEGILSYCPICYKNCDHIFNIEGYVWDHGSEEEKSMFCCKCGMNEYHHRTTVSRNGKST